MFFTLSAHGGENDHSAVWDAWNRDCFTCGISLSGHEMKKCPGNWSLRIIFSSYKYLRTSMLSILQDCCEDVHTLFILAGDLLRKIVARRYQEV